MRRKTIIKLAIFFSILILVWYLIYNPVLSWQDQKLIEKSKLLEEGMKREEVVGILGKPQMIKKVDLARAKKMSVPSDILEKIKKYDKKYVVVYLYYIPKLVPPLFLRREPAKTITLIFLDEYNKVIYVEIGEVAGHSLIPGGIDII